MRLNNAKKTLQDAENLDDYICALDAYNLADGKSTGVMEIGRQVTSTKMSMKMARASKDGT
jgi:hypothetical protein